MKFAMLGFAALAAIAVSPVAAPQARAADGNSLATAQRAQDFSAARRHYRRHHYAHRYHARPRVYGHGYGWSGADVNAGPNWLLSFYRRNHICAIDEGYGRATRCD